MEHAREEMPIEEKIARAYLKGSIDTLSWFSRIKAYAKVAAGWEDILSRLQAGQLTAEMAKTEIKAFLHNNGQSLTDTLKRAEAVRLTLLNTNSHKENCNMERRVISNIELSSMIRGFTGAVVGSGYSLGIDRVLWAMRPEAVEAIPVTMADAAAFAGIVIAQVESEEFLGIMQGAVNEARKSHESR